MSILRPCQRQAVASFWDTLSEDVNRVAIEMATGLGKTIVAGQVALEFLEQDRALDDVAPELRTRPHQRVLVLVHTDELVRQTVDKIHLVAKGHSVGVVKASRNETTAAIVVASVQTLAHPGRREQITDVGLIIVDECHHAVAATYQAILEHYGAYIPIDPHVYLAETPTPVLGLTATLARSDGQSLGNVWQALPFTRSIGWGIRQGYLVDLVPYTIVIPDLELAEGATALDAQMAESIAPELVVQAWLEKAEGRSTVLFAPLVASAQRFADAFSAAGVKAEVVHGAQHPDERAAVLARLTAGTTTVVCNAMVLTEGWDCPRVKCVIVARPTKSVPLFIQMVGRGLRPWLDAEAPPREEQECILLAVADTVTNLATWADLSVSPELVDYLEGRSLTQMEDQWDLGRDITPDELQEYRGAIRVERWDALVQRSSKAWKHTAGGVPFLPTAKKSQGYVFIVERAGEWIIWDRGPDVALFPGRMRTRMAGKAPDLELAMAVAEDLAQELGGDLGALLADKSRPWRLAVPGPDMTGLARRVGVPEKEIGRILTQRAAGKAGKLSDLIDKVQATKVIDPVAEKIRARSKA